MLERGEPIAMTSTRRRPARWFGAAVLEAALALSIMAGCKGESSGGTGGNASSSAGGDSSGTSSGAVCAADPRAQVYAVGLEGIAADKAMKIRFKDANPAPPSIDSNTFTIQVLDGSDKPVEGATITTVSYMPDHGHYSHIKPPSKPKASDGTYEITPVYLQMPGIWQITFTVQPAQGDPDSVMFTFCVEG